MGCLWCYFFFFAAFFFAGAFFFALPFFAAIPYPPHWEPVVGPPAIPRREPPPLHYLIRARV